MAIKKGLASTLGFGTADATGLTVTTSVSAEMGYATELFVKDNNGETAGMILADERGTATITGYAASAPSASLGSAGSDPSGTISGDIIIITGGLGPTKDDITKTTLAQYFEDTLVYDEAVLENIKYPSTYI